MNLFGGIILSFLALNLLAMEPSTVTPVWIDTDPSVARGGHEVDDGLALVQAFRSPQLTIRGVSVVFGNAPLETAFPIGQRLVRDFGPPQLAVHKGASSAQQLGIETDASRALATALSQEDLTILAIGPVTNVATVLQRHPELAKHVKEIVAVAGRRPNQHFLASPHAQPFRDFNFEMDPTAFDILLHSGVPLVLAPWELSSTVWIHQEDLNRMRASSPALAWVVDAASDWLALWKEKFGTSGFNPFDTLAVGYVLSPSAFRCQSLPIAIETLPDDTQGGGKGAKATKPYLVVDSAIKSQRYVSYCYEPPAGFAQNLVNLLSRPAFNSEQVNMKH